MPKDALFPTDAFLNEELLKLALESSGVAVWKMDPASGIIEASTACKRIMGLPPDIVVDYPFFLDLLHPEDRETTDHAVRHALDPRGDGYYAAEFRRLPADGGVQWISARGRAFFVERDGIREAAQFIGTIRDTTDAKAAEMALQQALEHQQTLLKEVNHRVKNSLQLVSSLLRLQARRIANPEVRNQLEDAMTRISTIAHIHQRLYRDQEVKHIDFGAFLAELCADFEGGAAGCTIHVDAPHIRVPTDRAVPLALIVNELVTNAIKYAYPDGRGGIISVGVSQAGSDEIVIRVADAGVGLPPDFSTENANSLGMVLIGSLLNQLNARVEMPSAAHGAVFIVTAPIEYPA